jgi:hypothetical protein
MSSVTRVAVDQLTVPATVLPSTNVVVTSEVPKFMPRSVNEAPAVSGEFGVLI